MALAAVAGAAATVVLGNDAVVIARVSQDALLDWPSWAHDVQTLQLPSTSIRDVLVVSFGRWRSLLCRDARCCPPCGRSLRSAA